MEHLFYLTGVKTQSYPIFINNWTDIYLLPNYSVYVQYIHQKAITAENIEALFTCFWRKKPSQKQRNVLQYITEKIGILQDLKTDEHPLHQIDLQFTELKFEEKAFLLHLLQPLKFPLWNTETIAALGFIFHKNVSYFKRKNKRKIYIEIFLPMLEKEFAQIPVFKVNQALFGFGKFLLEAKMQQQKIVQF